MLPLLCTVAGAQMRQELPPEPADLQAAYCFGYFKLSDGYSIDAMVATLPPERQQQARRQFELERANYQRVQAYIAGRIQHVDATGLLIASNQARLDMQAQLSQIESCARSCPTRECLETCKTSDQFEAKKRRCQTLDFLPY